MLQGVSHRHLSDHLSDLIETTLSELETAKIIAIDEDDDTLEALNSAMISSYYYLDYRTVELFQNSLTAKTKLKGLLEIISAASEFDELPVRPGEEESVERLLRHAKLAISKPEYSDPHTKANALIQVNMRKVSFTKAFSSLVVVTVEHILLYRLYQPYSWCVSVAVFSLASTCSACSSGSFEDTKFDHQAEYSNTHTKAYAVIQMGSCILTCY